jgi:hypothetical protein
VGYGVSICCGEEIATFPPWKMGEYLLLLGVVELFLSSTTSSRVHTFIHRCDCHTKHSYTQLLYSSFTHTHTHSLSLSLYSVGIHTFTMTVQLVVPNSEPKCPRGDRLQEEPSAKNAQGLFPPEACIFVGK